MFGGGSWSSDAYAHISSGHKATPTSKIFSRSLDKDMSPDGLKFRESRDSTEHPESLAVAIFLDVTGSMGRIPEIMVREKLGPLMDTIIQHGVKHPQILFGAIGDHLSDRAPLQVGQFESETAKIDECLTKVYIEGNGGGQNMESYHMGWLIGAKHTSIDCFEKRGQKGFLFTIGDEWCHDTLNEESLEKFLGYTEPSELTREKLLAEAQRMYHVFHIHINEASNRDDDSVIDPWRKLLGERFILLEDYNAIGETIATTIAMIHGIDLKKITAGFDKKIAATVTNALMHISNSNVATTGKKKKGIAKI